MQVIERGIIFQPMGRRVCLGERDERSILELARAAGVGVEATCGGKGVCGKCKVRLEGDVPAPTDRERRFLSGWALDEKWRLACQCGAPGVSGVWVPEESRPHRQVILTTGNRVELEMAPLVCSHDLVVPEATVHDQRSDACRLLDSLSAQVTCDDCVGMEFPLSVAAGLPGTLDLDGGRVSATVRNGLALLDVAPGHGAPCLGLAVDLGTTTMVAYLVDLTTGKVLSVAAEMNPQVQFGDDVISRISHAGTVPSGLEELSSLVREAVSLLASSACRDAGMRPERIMECVMVGNTAMHHIFLGLKPAGLAMAPYAPVFSRAWDLPAREAGLHFCPEAVLHWLPVKAGFVGADAVAVALAVEADSITQPTLILDLGTNGEMVLAVEGCLYCCSTAAGPAFEGGHIIWGMRGAPGAVEKVCIEPGSLRPELKVIGGAPPAGICGSGLVSLTAELLNSGALDLRGLFNPTPLSSRIRAGEHGFEYLLATADETAMGQNLVFTARDVSELQLAKAAIQAGALLMMKEAGVDRLEKVMLAGAFGNYLNPAEACRLGMFPGVEQNRVTGVGNAAGAGALMALLSRRHRLKAAEMADSMHYVELSGHPDFQDCFVDCLAFPPNTGVLE